MIPPRCCLHITYLWTQSQGWICSSLDSFKVRIRLNYVAVDEWVWCWSVGYFVCGKRRRLWVKLWLLLFQKACFTAPPPTERTADSSEHCRHVHAFQHAVAMYKGCVLSTCRLRKTKTTAQRTSAVSVPDTRWQVAASTHNHA